MTKPEISTSLISPEFDRRDGFSPLHSELSKPVSSKSKLRHLFATNPLGKHKPNKNASNNSISKHKASLEGGIKDLYPAKIHQSTDYTIQDKISESIRADSKGHHLKYKSFFKHRSSQPKALQISTNYTVQSSQDIINGFKASSVKNATCFDTYSPQQKIFGNENTSFLANLRSAHSQSVKNSQSQVLDPSNIKAGNPTGGSHKRSGQHPHHLSSGDINHKSMSLQSNSLVKMLSPQKVKPRDDRASISGLMTSNSKMLEKRRSSCRNRRCNQMSEIHDEPTSKLSTKTPSQFSEVRRSFPSQKSGSMLKQDTMETMEDDCRDISSSQKSNQTCEVKLSEGKRGSVSKTKNKEVNYYQILGRKAKSNVFLCLDPADIQGKNVIPHFAKAETTKAETTTKDEMKGKESDSRMPVSAGNENGSSSKKEESRVTGDDMDSAKEIIKALGSKGYDFGDHGDLSDLKGEMANSLSCISHHESQLEVRYSDIFASKELPEKEFIRTKTLLADHLVKEKIESPSGEDAIGKTLSNIMRRNQVQELKFQPNAKFLLLRKQVQEKRATRETKSFGSYKLMHRRENKSLHLGSNMDFNKTNPVVVPVNLEQESVQEKKDVKGAKSLDLVFQKTKQLLESYQEKEKDWMQEKQVLLTEILKLQERVEKK